MFGYRIHVPNPDDPNVKSLLASLGILRSPTHLNLYPVEFAEACGCFDNVARQVNEQGGTLVHGWQFWKHPYMIEAEFHAVWRSPDGHLHDITPKDDPEIKTTLFAVDEQRTNTGVQIDNVRNNTTGSGLIDDLIEVEKAKYRFLNKDGRDKIIGEVRLEAEDAQLWEAITKLSSMLEYLHLSGGDINFQCFCGSGVSYNKCHRNIVRKGILEI